MGGTQTAHERTSQASTGSLEQTHTEPCWRAANVEARWKKWCMSKTEQSCRQSNRLCKSSPYFLCDYGEKEAKGQNAVPAGGLSQVQPRATAQSPPGRAVRVKPVSVKTGFEPNRFRPVAFGNRFGYRFPVRFAALLLTSYLHLNHLKHLKHLKHVNQLPQELTRIPELRSNALRRSPHG